MRLQEVSHEQSQIAKRKPIGNHSIGNNYLPMRIANKSVNLKNSLMKHPTTIRKFQRNYIRNITLLAIIAALSERVLAN